MKPPARLYIREWTNDAMSVHDSDDGSGERHEYVRVDTLPAGPNWSGKAQTFAELVAAVDACGPLPSVLASSVPYHQPSPTRRATLAEVREFMAANGPLGTSVLASVTIGPSIEFSAQPGSFGLSGSCKCRVNWFGACWDCGAETT